LGVRNEVNLVVTLRQFEAQFRGHDTAAAVRRITGDSNLHVRVAAVLCDSMAESGSGCRFYTKMRSE
jgi:hypothetical protein